MAFKLKPTALEKLARKHHRAETWPIATVAFYGPDNTRASKVAVSIVPGPDMEPSLLERWFSDGDIRHDHRIAREIVAFIESHGAKRVAMSDGLLGCPHEEGVDYPEGEPCPKCPYWAGRDRWSGKMVH